MREKFVQRKFESDDGEIDLAASELGFGDESKFLLKKFKVNKSNFHEFFPPGNGVLLDPFLLDDMDKAAVKISEVIASGGSILIYGDYDADGISAAALLYNFFHDREYDDVCVHLPNRNEGYGLNLESLNKLFKQKHFDLLLTVDCGITGFEEVRFVKETLKSEVIVTDHHEICDALPDCICINPKKGYPIKDLSGSAVALKLVQALSDEETAIQYCDLAALGIIGDIMPLTGENRAIVNIGFQNVNNTGLKALLDAHKLDAPDCAALALKICPKLNAAGRVDDPLIAFKLLTSASRQEARQLAVKLFDINDTRRQLTDVTLEQALKQIADNNADTHRAIFVKGDWKPGMLGIVCNRLVDLFGVPAGVFTTENGKLVGSMRTVAGHDLLAVVSSVSEYLIRFGGHKASVGIALLPEKFEGFTNAFWENEVGASYSGTAVKLFDAEFSEFHLSDKFFNQLKSFEPIMPSDEVVLRGEFTAKNAVLFGKEKNHIKIITDNGAEIKGFYNFKNFYAALAAGCRFECLVTPEKDAYTNKISLLLQNLAVLPSLKLDNIYLENYLSRIDFGNHNRSKKITKERCEKLLADGGVCFVFNSYEEFEKSDIFPILQKCYLDFFYPFSAKENTVLISPHSNCDLSGFRAVVACCGKYGEQCGFNLSHHNVFTLDTIDDAPSFLYSQKISRDLCAAVYRAFGSGKKNYLNLNEAYTKLSLFEITYPQFLTAVKIFEELELIKITALPFAINIINDTNTELANSGLYKLVANN